MSLTTQEQFHAYIKARMEAEMPDFTDCGEPTEFFNLQLEEQLSRIRTLLLAKNRKYGNSALAPCRIFCKASPIVQIQARIDDKLNRLLQGEADEDEDVELDLIGYLILLQIARRNEHKELSQG